MRVKYLPALLSFIPAVLGFTASASSATLDPTFAADYSVNTFTGPNIPGPYGGLVFDPSNPNVLLLGASANNGAGSIYQVGVTRDAGGHITGTTSTSLYSTAPNIDGGLAFGPNGVLFYTGYSNNVIGQIAPGGTTPARVDSAPAALNSVGTLNFIPSGFANAGALVVGSYNNGRFGILSLTPDGSGTFNLGALSNGPVVPGGPEGIIYIKGGNPQFAHDSVLITQYGTGQVTAYEIDDDGLPILATARLFMSGLGGAEGAVIDPLTGDFLFSTFGGGNQIAVVQGFDVPVTPGVPEPSTWAMLILGFAGVGFMAHRRRKSATLAA